jgi:serine palmitoyltransferase
MPAKFDITDREEDEDVDIGYFTALSTYFGYGLLFALGHLRDFLVRCFRRKGETDEDNGFAPFVSSFEDFYTRRLYKRIHDCWNRPVSSCPAAWMDVMLRAPNKSGHLQLTGETKRCLNLGSYNYLGFGDPNSPTKQDVMKAVDKFGSSTASTRCAAGSTVLHQELEELVATYIGKEAALVYGMGFGTNSLGIPALIGGKRTLVISDANNHTSIVVGARTSGATIRVFSHNNPKHLEEVVRNAIIEGVPRQRRKWNKIFIVIEGIYSMEGEMCPLREIVAIKKKYKCYLYVDEAHSVGALGPNGRGIAEYMGVDTKDIDIMMGTFTKSFGAVGGYIASSAQTIAHLRSATSGFMYSQSISPPATAQIISAMKIMMGVDGTDLGACKLRSLREDSNYFRRRLKDMGCHVLGDEDSPIVPVMLYNSAKIPAFSRECFDRGLAVVVVGFPATQLLLSRTRFCISASHTREDLDWALERIEDVAHEIGIKYNKSWFCNF